MARRGHNEGTVYQRKDKRWEGQITLEGRKRKVVYGKTKAEALGKLRDLQLAKHDGKLSAEPTQKVSAYLVSWLDTIRSSVRPRTYDTYAMNVRRLTPVIGKIRLDQLKPAHVQQAYTELSTRGLSARSVQQAHMVLHRALGQAMKLGLVQRNVSEAVTAPRPAHNEMRTLSADQVETLIEATRGDRFHALWVLLPTTGLRMGEALGLKWDDIDWENRRLTVRRALQRQRQGVGLVLVEPKSESSRRTVHLGTTAISALQQHQFQQRKDQKQARSEWQSTCLVFCTITGSPLEAARINQQFSAALKKAGLPHVRVHDLRHTAATLLLGEGIHPRVVQEMLGHSNIALTLGTYSHVLPTMHKDAADRLDAVVFSRPL